MQEQEQKTEEGPRSFAILLNKLADGDAERDVSQELHKLLKELVHQATTQNREVKGSLELKLKFVADPRRTMKIGYDIKRTDPAKPRPSAVMFVTPGCNLTEDSPRQEQFPFRDVNQNKDQGPAKEAEGTTGEPKEV